jgi:DNA-binding NarL/FixJ family response regulator
MELRDLFSEDEVDERLDAQRALDGLSARDAAIVYLFACGHTQAEIGERVGLHQSQIGRILGELCKK